MLLLFAGEDYYPRGGWCDFIKVISSIDEIEPTEKSRVYLDGLNRSRRYRWVEINLRNENGEQLYEWWHVVDTDTMKIVAESEESRELVDEGVKQ